MADVPLRFTCQHEVYKPGVKDAHGNEIPGWWPAVARDCIWWAPSSTEPPQPPTGGDRVIADVLLVIDSAVTVDHRDRFTVDSKAFSVVGLPKDYDHGPFCYAPNRRIVELKWVGG
ncbi:hypothetical protein [Mycobacterium sp. HM-7]